MDRRTFLGLMGQTTLASALPWSIERALAIPAHNSTGTLQDVEHIVILMQENRSFDHYFGTLRGVRGFRDPRAVNLPSGKPVWYQSSSQGTVLPYRPTLESSLGSAFISDHPHDWKSTQAVWNHGNYDQWVPQKGTSTMVHMNRQDIPFHFALADAFTICDAYHCAVMSSTSPNRYYMWTGGVGFDVKTNHPILDNTVTSSFFSWKTYPEVLEEAGVSWKIYQDIGLGLDIKDNLGETENPYIGTFGDSSLLFFAAYNNAQPGTPLYEKAKTGTNVANGGGLFDVLRNDVQNGKLPQVSWIVAPEAYSEHPNWPSNSGAWYIDQVLQVLTSNEEVWSKTALFLVYDENDGFFDHVPPPVPPLNRDMGLSTVNTELDCFYGNTQFAAGPLGLGPRVPLLVISPWSKGGFVCSEVFNHTSLIQFIEKRFGKDYPNLQCENISPWRRAICGDLTSAFNFAKPKFSKSKLVDTSGYLPPDQNRHVDYEPLPPPSSELPVQEAGLRPARPLPYILKMDTQLDLEKKIFHFNFVNKGKAGACIQLRIEHAQQNPKSYTIEAQKTLADSLQLENKYSISAYGPNGFFRSFQGDISLPSPCIKVTEKYDHWDGNISLHCLNEDRQSAVKFTVENIYNKKTTEYVLLPGEDIEIICDLQESFGWYDVTIREDAQDNYVRRLAGHVETGRESMSDPLLGY